MGDRQLGCLSRDWATQDAAYHVRSGQVKSRKDRLADDLIVFGQDQFLTGIYSTWPQTMATVNFEVGRQVRSTGVPT